MSSCCEISSSDSNSWSQRLVHAVPTRPGRSGYAAARRGLNPERLATIESRRMVEMEIYGVSFDIVGKMPIVLLKTADGSRYLPDLDRSPGGGRDPDQAPELDDSPRPMTHDLFVEMLAQLDVRVVRITVTELRENTFYAAITIAQDGQEIEIDSRPSDAIALAIRTEAPIFADERVIEENGDRVRAGGGRGGRSAASPSRSRRSRSRR